METAISMLNVATDIVAFTQDPHSSLLVKLLIGVCVCMIFSLYLRLGTSPGATAAPGTTPTAPVVDVDEH